MTTSVAYGDAAHAAPARQLAVLLIEDDDGDAVLVQELLSVTDSAIAVDRAKSLAEAKSRVSGAGCVLLDLGLPDARGLEGVRWLVQNYPETTVVVLTGLADDHLGEDAVRAGAQDYLVKGEVSGEMLHRVIRYATERKRWDEAQRQLHIAKVNAAENARLERGLLPLPVLTDPKLQVSARCWAGGKQRLLGGDFYDVVETADGQVHALVGDVCGHGPAEAALGVCLRVAWRALMLANRPAEEVLSTVQQVLGHEQHEDAMFATVCMVSVARDRSTAVIRLAGHPGPLLVTEDVKELCVPASPPLGLNTTGKWPGSEVELGASWTLLLYTDGLIEGRVSRGPSRLGTRGLMEVVRAELGPRSSGRGRVATDGLPAVLMDEVLKLTSGTVTDDMCVLALSRV